MLSPTRGIDFNISKGKYQVFPESSTSRHSASARPSVSKSFFTLIRILPPWRKSALQRGESSKCDFQSLTTLCATIRDFFGYIPSNPPPTPRTLNRSLVPLIANVDKKLSH